MELLSEAKADPNLRNKVAVKAHISTWLNSFHAALKSEK